MVLWIKEVPFPKEWKYILIFFTVNISNINYTEISVIYGKA